MKLTSILLKSKEKHQEERILELAAALNSVSNNLINN